MGTWGAGILHDDLALDVRGDYRDLVADGSSGAEATDVLLKRYRQIFADPHDGAVFWLALAATQWECGRLESRVREQAMTLVDTGAALTRWGNDPKPSNKRRLALKRLRAKLLAPQPAEKRIRKRYRDTCEWEVGEVIAYRLASGRTVLLRVVSHTTDPLGTSPVCELLDWIGSEPPTKRVMKKLRVRSQDSNRWPITSQFSILRTTEKEMPLDRIVRLRVKLKPSAPSAASSFFMWKNFDEDLEVVYGSLVRRRSLTSPCTRQARSF